MIFIQIMALEEVVKAVDGKAEVYMDSGVRLGTDVLKALSLGARAVIVGKPVLWGLTVGVCQTETSSTQSCSILKFVRIIIATSIHVYRKIPCSNHFYPHNPTMQQPNKGVIYSNW